MIYSETLQDRYAAEQMRNRFAVLAEEARLQADRYAEHVAELDEFLDGKVEEFPQGARYAARYVRSFVPEGRIVIPAPKKRVIVVHE